MESTPTLLAGDIGGTRSRFALFTLGEDGTPFPLATHEYPSRVAPPADHLDRFLTEMAARPAAPALAVAAPAGRLGGIRHARLTNLPWCFDEAGLSASLGEVPVRLLNDFEAAAHGLEMVSPERLVTLQPGDPIEGGPRALIGAGTGLGQAWLARCGEEWRVQPTEGGHADYAPADATGTAFAAWLRDRHGHASWERVVSGPGLAAMFRFLCETRRHTPTQSLEEAREEDLPATIQHAAERGEDPVAVEALERFMFAFGAQAGNLALTLMPTGGLFLAGGIAPRILPHLKSGPFLAAFRAKGRMSGLMERFPVQVVTEPALGLLGAAVVAARLART